MCIRSDMIAILIVPKQHLTTPQHLSNMTVSSNIFIMLINLYNVSYIKKIVLLNDNAFMRKNIHLLIDKLMIS